MNLVKLSDEELTNTKGGELTIASVMAVLIIGIVTVACYKLLKSNTGKTILPGGFTFTWA